MNAVENLKLRVEEVLPNATCSLDAGEGPGAPWFLDCQREDRLVTVEWREGSGFGISAGIRATMEGPDEVYPDVSDALSSVLSLLRARPPRTAPAPGES
jgi:hypothetical protein